LIKLELINKEMTRVLIAEQGRNLRGFANHIDISQTYLTQILNGYRNPSPTVAYKIAKGLNQDIKDIFSINSFAKDNNEKDVNEGGRKFAERPN